MKTKLALAISAALALTACDDYELASEGDGFHSVGSVMITGEAINKEILTADISDGDGFDEEAVTYTWTANDSIRTDITGKTYTLTESDIDSVFKVKVEYVDNAGYNEVAISSYTDVVEEIAVPSPATVAITGEAYVGFILTAEITDENGASENEITYTWMAGGVAIEDATDAKLLLTEDHEGEAITVSVTFMDDDGFQETDVVSDPTDPVSPAAESSKVAAISDSMDNDIGELRLKFADSAASIDPILKGKLSVKFAKETVLSGDTAKEAYIALWGNSTTTDNALVDLRIGNGDYTIREPKVNTGDLGKVDLDTPSTFTPGDWINVDMVWDASLAIPTVTVFLDDVEVYSAETTSGDISSLTDGVQHVVFKLGDTSSVSTGTFRVDDLEIYDDQAGTSLVWEDDFESYTTGYSLDKSPVNSIPENIDTTTPYNSNTEEVVIEEVLIGAVTAPPVVVGGQALSLTDKTGDTSGQAKFPLGAATEKGKLTISFYKEPSQGWDGTTEENEKDAYIGLYTSNGSNANAIIDLRLHGAYPDDGGLTTDGEKADYGTLEQRNGSGLELSPAVPLTATDSSIVAEGNTYNQGVNYSLNQWHELVMEWDATSATEAATVTVTLDGVAYPAFPSASVQAVTDDAVVNLTIKYGDTTRHIPNAEFHIDDIKVYSIDPVSGAETLDLDYNFDSQTIGDAPIGASTAVEATITERTL